MAEEQTPQQEAAKLQKTPVAMGDHGLVVKDHSELYRVAQTVAKSQLVPEAFRGKPEDCFLAMAMGMELGFSPFVALQSFFVHKGKVGVPGEVMLSLIQGSPDCRSYQYGWEGEGDERHAWVQSWRRNREEPYPKATFSVAQARQAGLYDEKFRDRNNQPSVWVKYTDDMLLWKAVARDCRRNWPDKTKRAPVAEDMPGYGSEPEERNITPQRPQATAPAEPPQADPAMEILGASPETIDVSPEPAAEPVSQAESPGEASPAADAGPPARMASAELEEGPEQEPESTGGAAPAPDSGEPQPDPDAPIQSDQVQALRKAISDRAERFIPERQAEAKNQIELGILKKGKVERLEDLATKHYSNALSYAKNAKLNIGA